LRRSAHPPARRAEKQVPEDAQWQQPVSHDGDHRAQQRAVLAGGLDHGHHQHHVEPGDAYQQHRVAAPTECLIVKFNVMM